MCLLSIRGRKSRRGEVSLCQGLQKDRGLEMGKIEGKVYIFPLKTDCFVKLITIYGSIKSKVSTQG